MKLRLAGGLVGLCAVGWAGLAVSYADADPAPADSLTTFGTIPPEAFRSSAISDRHAGDERDPLAQPADADGLDRRKVPDYVQVEDDRAQVVGYVKKAELLDRQATTMTVYARDGKTVVGTMVADRGFVPRGADPESAPGSPTTTVTGKTS